MEITELDEVNELQLHPTRVDSGCPPRLDSLLGGNTRPHIIAMPGLPPNKVGIQTRKKAERRVK
jgi:hypothetical protein